MFKEFFKEYFQFTRSERIGTAVLIFLIILILVATIILPKILPKQVVDFTEFQKEIERWDSSGNQDDSIDTPSSAGQNNIDENYYHLFDFDPNTITEVELKNLGLNSRIVNTLLKYREKGGVFYEKEDIKKIYGMNDSIYAIIDPYILIHTKEKPKKIVSDTSNLIIKEVVKPIIEINSADSVSLLKLYGIGPVFAGRILKYRNLLGGFVRKDQLLEVYGITPETYLEIEQNFVLERNFINKINVNTATFKQLIKHPYLDSYQVNAILEYRNIQGRINSIEELVDNKLLTEDVFQKINPYLEVLEDEI